MQSAVASIHGCEIGSSVGALSQCGCVQFDHGIWRDAEGGVAGPGQVVVERDALATLEFDAARVIGQFGGAEVGAGYVLRLEPVHSLAQLTAVG